MNSISIYVFFSLSCSVLHAQNISKTITVDGVQRKFIMHLPPSFDVIGKMPVLFALHGGGGTAKGAVPFYNLESLADKNNFIVVYPDAINKAWSIPGMASRVKRLDTTVNDLRFMNMLLDTMIINYKADSAKVFCTGISRGAMFSYYLAHAMNTRITAVAGICGGISQTQAQTYSLKKPLPVLIINGTADPLVKYNGGYGSLNKRNKGDENADMLATEDLVKKIVLLNHCDATPETFTLPDADADDGCAETEYIYDCGSVKVDFIKINGGGHTWAGGNQYLPKFLIGRLCKDFNASQKVFDFFMSVK